MPIAVCSTNSPFCHFASTKWPESRTHLWKRCFVLFPKLSSLYNHRLTYWLAKSDPIVQAALEVHNWRCLRWPAMGLKAIAVEQLIRSCNSRWHCISTVTPEKDGLLKNLWFRLNLVSFSYVFGLNLKPTEGGSGVVAHVQKEWGWHCFGLDDYALLLFGNVLLVRAVARWNWDSWSAFDARIFDSV